MMMKILPALISQALGTAPPTGPTLAFHALDADPSTYEMKGVLTGVGGLTTTHASTIYAADVDGVYRAFAANQPVWEGGRVASNYINSGNAGNNAPSSYPYWISGSQSTLSRIEDSNDDVILANDDNSASGNSFIKYVAGLTTVAGSTITASFKIKGVGTSIGKTVAVWLVNTTYSAATITLTSEYQRVSITGTNATSAPQIQVFMSGLGGTLATNEQIIVGPPMLEYGAQTSEHVSVYIPIDETNLASSDIADWTATNLSSATDEGSYWQITCSGSNNHLTYNVDTVPGQCYVIKAEIYAPSSNTQTNMGRLLIESETARANGGVSSEDGWLFAQFAFVATSSSTAFRLQVASTLAWGSPGDVSRFRNIGIYRSGSQIVYANANGNSVTNNVVTEGLGAPLAELPYLKYQPAATNSLTYSRDMSNAAWQKLGATAAYTQTGLDGSPNSASLLTDTGAAYGEVKQLGVAIVADAVTMVFYVQKDLDETRFPEFSISLNGTVFAVQFNTRTGAYTFRTGGGTGLAEVVDCGDWWKLLVYCPRASSTSLNIIIMPAISDVFGSTNINAAGSFVIGNVELHLNKTIAQVRGLGPIFTTTAAVTTNSTALSFDGSNHNPLEAAWYQEWVVDGMITNNHLVGWERYVTAGADDATLKMFMVMVGANTAGVQSPSSRYLNQSDTTSNVTHSTDATARLLGHQGVVYSAGVQKITLRWKDANGVHDLEALDFKSTLDDNTKPLVLANRGTAWTPGAVLIRNLRRYGIASYQEGKDILDTLMGA